MPNLPRPQDATFGTLILFLALACSAGACRGTPEPESAANEAELESALPGARASLVEGASEATPPRQLVVHEVSEEGNNVVVLLHGYGAQGNDLVPLAESLVSPGLRFLLPEAPHPHPSLSGRMWYELRRSDSDTLKQSREQLEALLFQLESEGVNPEQIILGGFSQGAMISLHLAQRRAAEGRAPLGGLILLSGSTLDSEWQNERDRAPVAANRVFVAHGRRDQVLPHGVSEQIAQHLSGLGVDVTEVYFDGGHSITPLVREELQQWLVQ